MQRNTLDTEVMDLKKEVDRGRKELVVEKEWSSRKVKELEREIKEWGRKDRERSAKERKEQEEKDKMENMKQEIRARMEYEEQVREEIEVRKGKKRT